MNKVLRKKVLHDLKRIARAVGNLIKDVDEIAEKELNIGCVSETEIITPTQKGDIEKA